MYSTLTETRNLSVAHGQESELLDSEEILLREFRPNTDDERQMRDLVFDNAFLGQPFDVICPCKRWFGDVVLTPYIRYQSKHIHVAVHQNSGRLVGYLTGATAGQQFETLQYNWVRKQVMSLAISLTMPWTFFDQSSRLFTTHVIFKGERERPSHPQSGVHWHYQVANDFRGQGVGRVLVERAEGWAKARGLKSVYVRSNIVRKDAHAFYQKLGYKIIKTQSAFRKAL